MIIVVVGYNFMLFVSMYVMYSLNEIKPCEFNFKKTIIYNEITFYFWKYREINRVQRDAKQMRNYHHYHYTDLHYCPLVHHDILSVPN